MWQKIDLDSNIYPLIDNQTLKFNLSAWLGGFGWEGDNVIIYLTFGDADNQMCGSTYTIGPVSASNRGFASSLLFRKVIGLVPIGARFLTVLVTINRIDNAQNNGNVDNIALALYV